MLFFFFTLHTGTTFLLTVLYMQDYKSYMKIVYYLLNADGSFKFFGN